MDLRDHDDDAGKTVWLSEDVTMLLEAAPSREQRVAFALGVRCGLRSKEVLDVSPQDVAEMDTWAMLRVREGKVERFARPRCPRSSRTPSTVTNWPSDWTSNGRSTSP